MPNYKTRLYKIYAHMKRRCYSETDESYSYYGGRGITICDEWLNDFEAFKAWSIENGYADDLTIDRIDNFKGYSPDNCRWVTRKVQQNNLRSNHRIVYNGEEHTLTEWAAIIGINPETLANRLNQSDYSIERALTEPVFETYEINGETHTLTEWVNLLGLKFSTVANRIMRGMSPVEALTKPIRKAAKDYAYTYNGETHSLKEWSLITGIPITTLHNRIKRGWSVQRMLTQPKQ